MDLPTIILKTGPTRYSGKADGQPQSNGFYSDEPEWNLGQIERPTGGLPWVGFSIELKL